MDPFWTTLLTFVGAGWAGMLLMAMMNVVSRDTDETRSLDIDPQAMELGRPFNQGDEDHARR